LQNVENFAELTADVEREVVYHFLLA
jgi:hypothetical protein